MLARIRPNGDLWLATKECLGGLQPRYCSLIISKDDRDRLLMALLEHAYASHPQVSTELEQWMRTKGIPVRIEEDPA